MILLGRGTFNFLSAIACLAILASPATAADPAARTRTSLAQFLSGDGQLQLPAGFVGNIDPNGWEMAQSPGAGLRFAAKPRSSGADKLFGVPGGCNGHIFAMTVAPSGLIYIGGEFSVCEEVPASLVVAYDPRSQRFLALGEGSRNGVNGSDPSVYALTLSGTDLYVAGHFDQAGGEPANSIARWDGQQWSALGSGENNGTSGIIYDLAATADGVYAAGNFDLAGGQSANRVARWDGSQWSTLGSGISGVEDGYVGALALVGSDLYAGGSFDTAGGVAAHPPARGDRTAWAALGSGPGNGTDAPVNALAVSGSELLVGGQFTTAGGQSANHVARWNGSAWSVLGSASDNGVGDAVYALLVSGTDVYAGGNFGDAGGQPARSIARWNGLAWSGLGEDSANGVNSTVFAIVQSGSDLFLGGYFDQAGGEPANFAARWNGSFWSALGSGAGNGVNNVIEALAVNGNDLYVGGRLSQAGGQPANYVARWNGSAWSSLGDGPGNGVNSDVLAMGIAGGDLIVGGYFSQAGGQPANLIARWNGSAWSTLGDGLGGGDYPSVQSITAVGSDLYVGGEFIEAGGQAAYKIARWNGSTWSALGVGAANGLSRGDFIGVQAIAAAAGNLYVGGNFTEAGGQPARQIAKWNGSNWSTLGVGIDNGVNSTVYALAVLGNDLYAGGNFFEAGGVEAYGVARWNGTTWSSLGSDASNGVNGAVRALAVSGSTLYVGGSFTVAGGQPANGLARWDGSHWTGLSVDAPPQVVRALTSDGDSLYAGGAGLSQTPLPDLQSRALLGAAANGASSSAVVSRNGSVLGFVSEASNITSGDANGRSDIFVRDRILGQTQRASSIAENLNGGASEAFSEPALSADGTRLAFSGSSGQIYAALQGSGRVLSSSALGALGNAASRRVQLPGSGELAFFDSQASNLLPVADENGAVSDIFMKDLASGAVQLISRGPNGEPANGASSSPWASDDGQSIVFQTLATNIVPAAALQPDHGKAGTVLQATMMRGGGFGQTRFYLSRNLGTGELGNADSTQVKLTPDGRYGVFESLASNLVDGDSNQSSDIFRFEINNNALVKLERVSVSRHGFQSNGASKNASISDDGQFVTFETNASNLIELDRNDTSDILVKWMVTGELLRLSRTVDDQQPNGPSSAPAMAGDGSAIVFASAASNLSPGDSNGQPDVFAVPLRGSGPVNPSGAWYDPAQDGHGLQMELLPGNRLLAFWYTFDPAGHPAYFLGDGAFDGHSATLNNLRPVGSFFPPNFNPAQLDLQSFGSMTIRFDSCAEGLVSFNLPQGFGQGSMRLARLTQPLGVACNSSTSAPVSERMAAASGVWYNPQLDGQGLVIESLGGDLLLATWYSQAPSPSGGQSWFTGLGTINGNQATLDMLIVEGGRFIPNFDPASIVRRPLGSMTLNLDSCSSGQLGWAFGNGYGSGSMLLQKLTTPAGVVCSEQ
jgi:trimeric autotransporter adhesin